MRHAGKETPTQRDKTATQAPLHLPNRVGQVTIGWWCRMFLLCGWCDHPRRAGGAATPPARRLFCFPRKYFTPYPVGWQALFRAFSRLESGGPADPPLFMETGHPAVGSISVGLAMGCSLWATMAWISSTVRPSPRKLLLRQKS